MRNNNRKLIACLVTLLFLVSGITYSGAADENQPSVDSGYANVLDYGAIPGDRYDDQEAFSAALATGKSLYVPQGEYLVSGPIVLRNQLCVGAGLGGRTKLIGISEDSHVPVFIMEGCSTIQDLYVAFRESYLTFEEKQGERVGIQLGSADHPLTAGSVVRNVYFAGVGTGIYAPADSEVSGALIEAIEVQRYTYRGIDMQSQDRKMNTYCNMYINAGSTSKNISSGFALEGSEYGPVVSQLNVEHDYYQDEPIIFRNVKNLVATAIHLEGVVLMKPDKGYLCFDNTSGYVGSISAYWTYITTERNSLASFGNAPGDSKLRIGNIHLKGINSPDAGNHPDWQTTEKGINVGAASSWRVLDRKKESSGQYKVDVEHYVYFTHLSQDIEKYKQFEISGNLSVTRPE